MKAFLRASLALVAVLASGCVNRHVTDSVEGHAVIEGARYADEVEAQSPFKTVELSWREAQDLMTQRNPAYRAARADYQEATAHTPIVKELSEQVKKIVDLSPKGGPSSLMQGLPAPVARLPQQLASIGKLKDLSHEVEQSTWEKIGDSVAAELKMRREKVKLHRLLRTGELIDHELACINSAPPLPSSADAKLLAARRGWNGSIRKERESWLDECRDIFDAEYHDIRFKKDGSGLSTYRRTENPELTEWQRWCRLHRSRELVAVLQEEHEESKPAIPGTRMVTDKFAGLMPGSDGGSGARIEVQSVRNEVRMLIRSWREMKEVQAQAEQLEQSDSKELDSIARVTKRKAIFKLRQEEIKHASVVWMLDEECWD